MSETKAANPGWFDVECISDDGRGAFKVSAVSTDPETGEEVRYAVKMDVINLVKLGDVAREAAGNWNQRVFGENAWLF